MVGQGDEGQTLIKVVNTKLNISTFWPRHKFEERLVQMRELFNVSKDNTCFLYTQITEFLFETAKFKIYLFFPIMLERLTALISVMLTGLTLQSCEPEAFSDDIDDVFCDVNDMWGKSDRGVSPKV